MIKKKSSGMGPYNGFPGALRNLAQRWLNGCWGGGALKRPEVCMACSQDTPPIDAHAEDYSQPFAAGKTDEFHLCYSCHMAVHCRFKNPEAWDNYRALVAVGGRYPWLGRNFPVFMGYYTGKEKPEIIQGPAPARLVLDEIDGWMLAKTGKGWR